MKRLNKILIGTVLLSSFFTVGCTPVYNTAQLYKSGSKTRGITLMLPVTQSTRSILTSSHNQWDLSEEFSCEIARRLGLSSKLYLLNQNVSSSIAEAFNSPSGKVDHSLASQIFPAEFVIATEILEQSIPNNESEPICLSARVRVFDVRKNCINMVYQEIIETKQTQTGIGLDNVLHWTHKNFESTPLGLAHSRLIKEMVARVEGYICVNY